MSMNYLTIRHDARALLHRRRSWHTGDGVLCSDGPVRLRDKVSTQPAAKFVQQHDLRPEATAARRWELPTVKFDRIHS